MTLEILSRVQFAFTVMFHMTFPAITVGLGVFLCVVYGLHWRTGHVVYLQMFRFWRRIFAVGFALGVVAGTVITFEFGLNWGGFAAATGPVIAPIIGMEVVTAFFVEAGFIGVMLYGDGRVKKAAMFWASFMVALGTILSTTWIIVANSWMQTPSGYAIDAAGRFVPTDWWQVIFSPSFGIRYAHMLLAVLISASLFIAGLSAYFLLRGRVPGMSRRSFSIAMGMLAILIPLQLTVGDHVALDYVAHFQPAKIEALEGNWASTNTGYNLFVIPDQTAQRNLVQIALPLFGSFLLGDFTGQTPTPGLAQTPVADQPLMWTVFWGFRVMFFGSMVIFAAAMTGTVLRLKGRLYTSRRFHRFVMWLTPVGIIVILGGWVTAETGRQPFVVYGQLRTADAVSQLATPQLIVSVAGFILLYLSLLVFYIVYIVRTMHTGPEQDAATAVPVDNKQHADDAVIGTASREGAGEP